MTAIGLHAITLDDFSLLLNGDAKVELAPAALEKIAVNFRFLQTFSADKLIYGINTGFGPMAQYKVSPDKLLELQYNLIRSHCSGSGQLLPSLLSKALMIARLNSLMQGYSGVHPDTVLLLAALINHDILPCVYEHGGVGASGDLVQLAHLALTLIGEGEVHYKGQVRPTLDVMTECGIKPLTIQVREGLAILNGTSAMTGIGMLNIIRARTLLGWGVLLSSLTNEIVGSFSDHYCYALNVVKHHPGQLKVASLMNGVLGDSGMIRNRSDHFYHPDSDHTRQDVFEDKVQEYYSLRCVPQVLGPVYDTITQADTVLTHELNSVNDNPVIDHLNQNVYHGGNFHGDYVSLEMDKLKIAITRLSMLSERQLNYLMNEKLNVKFPPFMNLGVLGLNFGMQGMQFTATSTVAENQTLSFPMYVHSIPNNNDNQDIVSMGANAALMSRRVISNSFEVLAIQLMSLLQAIDYAGGPGKLASGTRALYTDARAVFPVFIEDKPKYKDLEKVRLFLEDKDPFQYLKNPW